MASPYGNKSFVEKDISTEVSATKLWRRSIHGILCSFPECFLKLFIDNEMKLNYSISMRFEMIEQLLVYLCFSHVIQND